MTKSRFHGVILSGILLAVMVQASASEGGEPMCGCGGTPDVWRKATARLAEAKALRLYALDPEQVYDDRVLAMQGRDVFRDHAIRGFVEVKAPFEVRRITRGLIADANLHGCELDCYNARYGVRFFLLDRETIDFVICSRFIQIRGAAGDGWMPSTCASEDLLSSLLRQAGVEVLPPAAPPKSPWGCSSQ